MHLNSTIYRLSIYCSMGLNSLPRICGCFVIGKTSDSVEGPVIFQQVVYGKRKSLPGWFSNCPLVLQREHHMLESGALGPLPLPCQVERTYMV